MAVKNGPTVLVLTAGPAPIVGMDRFAKVFEADASAPTETVAGPKPESLLALKCVKTPSMKGDCSSDRFTSGANETPPSQLTSMTTANAGSSNDNDFSTASPETLRGSPKPGDRGTSRLRKIIAMASPFSDHI
jgi:hypothetical protein